MGEARGSGAAGHPERAGLSEDIQDPGRGPTSEETSHETSGSPTQIFVVMNSICGLGGTSLIVDRRCWGPGVNLECQFTKHLVPDSTRLLVGSS